MPSKNDHTEHVHSSGIFGEKTELWFAVLSGIFWVSGLVLGRLASPEWVPLACFVTAYFFGGYYTTLTAVKTIRSGAFEIDFLMIAAALGAAYIGRWQEGALLLFLFSLGHALEHYAMDRARKSIRALGNLSPKTALLKENGTTREIAIDELQPGDIIVVKPNSKIAADGFIVRGESSIDQAAITGESLPVFKSAVSVDPGKANPDDIDKKHLVYTGTINGDSPIEVKVLKRSADSTIARIIQMVSEAENRKSPTQRLTKKFEKWFVPVVILFVTCLCFAFLVIDESWRQSFYRAITVLVAASPCALAISTPSAVLSGIARAARGGVLVKGGRALEQLGAINALAFDKTGTLTQGKPKLTGVYPSNPVSKDELLKTLIAVESLSDHPISKAVVAGAAEMLPVPFNGQASNLVTLQGRGLSAAYKDTTIYVGNDALFRQQGINLENGITEKMTKLQQAGHTVSLVGDRDGVLGMMSVMDTPRAGAKNVLTALREKGIGHMIMLSGDDQRVADAIAREIGLTEARGNLMPEDKVAYIKQMKAAGIAMVGDGVNDAPAMAESTVGIAMGAAGSDVALETADVALMSDKLENLPFVIGLSRATKAIIHQNLWISMGMVAFLVPATLLGYANIGLAVLLHEGSTLVVVGNALRLLRYRSD